MTRIGMLAGWIAVFFTARLADGQTAAPATPSNGQGVAQLTAMLQSIDPYRPSKEHQGFIKVVGSTAMDAVAHMWGVGFKQFHPKINVEVTAAGSGDALKQMVTDPKVVAMLSRPVQPEELADLKKQGVKEPTAFVVAREALGVWVHASNPIASISGEQLRAVFTKGNSNKIPTWGELGVTGSLASKPINIILRPESSGTHSFLRDFVFAGAEMRSGKEIQNSNAEVLSSVSKDPASITICGLRATGKLVRAVPLIAGGKPIPSDDASVLSGKYPLTRTLTIVLDMSQQDSIAQASQEFVHYALCQAAQLDAIRAGFFPAELPMLRAGLDRLQGNQLR